MNKNIIKVLPLAAMVFTLASCNNAGYHVDLIATHGEWKGNNSVGLNENYSATYVPEAGYVLNPADLVVKVNNNIIEEKAYTFKDNNLVINKDYVIGDIVVKADPSAEEYDFEFIEEGETTTIGASTPEGNPKYHTNFNVKFAEFRESYRLPDNMNVYVNGEQLDTSKYAYNPTERTLMIYADYVTGNVLISAKAIQLISMTFNANGGTWPGQNVQTVYVDKGANFKSAKDKLVGTLYAPEAKYQFGHWEDENQFPIKDSDVVLPGMTVYATWDTKQLNVEVDDNHSYFPSNYWQEQTGKQTIDYGSPLDLTFKIKEGDETRYCIPKNIRDVRVNGASLAPGDYSYNYTASPESGTLNINGSVMTGDVMIELYTPAIASISFNPGEGKWNGTSSDPVIANIRMGDVYDYTVYEALRMIAHQENDPIANDSTKKFVGWALEDDLDKKLIDENAIVTREMNLVAQYEEIDFENDTWENVINYANQGLTELYNHYDTTEENLIGCTRTIIAGNNTLGYVKEKVRVIGVAHDTIVDEGEHQGEKAAITFEYCNAPFEAPFGSTAIYTSSSLRDSINLAISNLPNELQEAIHTVEKKTFNPTMNKYESTNDKVFLLSANELGLQSSDMPGGASVKTGEGDPYAQYQNASADRRIKGNSFKTMTSEGYWIRSVDYQDYGSDNTKGYSIDAEGKVAISNSNTTTLGAPFAFAIGVEGSSVTTHEGTIKFNNCINKQSKYSDDKFIINNDEADTLDIYVYTEEYSDFTFPAQASNAIKITTDAGQVMVTTYNVLESGTTAFIEINYDSVAAAKTNSITIAIEPTLYKGQVSTNYCTSETTEFEIIKGVAGGGHITATANDGRAFDATTPTNNLSCSPTGKITFSNIVISTDGDTIDFDYNYTKEAADGSYLTISITAKGYLGVVEAADCTPTMTSFTVVPGKAGTGHIEATATDGYAFSNVDPSTHLSRTIRQGTLNFSNVQVSGDKKTISFDFSYNTTAASGGSIKITITAVSE